MQKVIVTGCSQGMGLETCRKFEREGYKVFGIDLNVGDYTGDLGSCDLLELEGTQKKLETLFADHGTPDVLVNNAGIYFGTNGEQQSLEEYEKTMQINSRAVFFLSQLMGRRWIQERTSGCIVNVTSVSGRIGSIDPGYAASKAAADALTKSFARTFAPYNIRVNGVAPGPINTALAERIPPERKKEYVKSILQNRFGEASEIANVIYFLASEAASYMTGEIVYATGGIL